MDASEQLDCTNEAFLKSFESKAQIMSRKEVLGKKKSFLMPAAKNRKFPMNVYIAGVTKQWAMDNFGQNTQVAVVDTGIGKHSDLNNIVERWSYSDSDYTNLNPHGTHVAGTIGALGSILGGAPKTGIIDVKVFDEDGRSDHKNFPLVMRKIRERGIPVVNMSLGSIYNNPLFHEEIKKCADMGILCVVAAGNEGSHDINEHSHNYPAFYPETLSVAGVDYLPTTGTISMKTFQFSRNERNDVSAHACNVLSTFPDNKYGVLSGTSMGTPLVSAVASLEYTRYTFINKNRKFLSDSSKFPDIGILVKSNLIDIKVEHLGIKETDGRDAPTGDGFVTYFHDPPIVKNGKPVPMKKFMLSRNVLRITE